MMNSSIFSLNPFDLLLIVILAWSTITAFWRGIVWELFSIGGLIAGIILASWNYQYLASLLTPMLDRAFNDSEAAGNILAFLIIAIGVMLLALLTGRLIRNTAHTIGLGLVDRLLGALFGFARGCLLGVAILTASTAFLPHSTQIANSRLTPYFLAGVHAVSFVVPAGLQQQLLNGIAQLKHTAPDWIKLHP
jgi:membrane protein required for colicin V production